MGVEGGLAKDYTFCCIFWHPSLIKFWRNFSSKCPLSKYDLSKYVFASFSSGMFLKREDGPRGTLGRTFYESGSCIKMFDQFICCKVHLTCRWDMNESPVAACTARKWDGHWNTGIFDSVVTSPEFEVDLYIYKFYLQKIEEARNLSRISCLLPHSKRGTQNLFQELYSWGWLARPVLPFHRDGQTCPTDVLSPWVSP